LQEVIAWATFAGAWLLVAGPLYQGSAELAELDFDREGIQGAAAAVQAAQTRPSAWWWLLPPAMYVLHRRWYKALRLAMLPQLTQTRREQVTRFQSKSTGWFTVAAGATLLAAGDTWQIIQHYRWPVWAFWLLDAVMLTAAVLTTTVLMIGEARMRHLGGTEPPPAAGQR
jgi:cobalamin synthase